MKKHSKILDLVELALQYCPAVIRETTTARDFIKVRNWIRLRSNFETGTDVFEFVMSLKLDVLKTVSLTLSLIKLIKDIRDKNLS